MTLNRSPIRLASSMPLISPTKWSVLSVSWTIRSSDRPASSSVAGAVGWGRIDGRLGLLASIISPLAASRRNRRDCARAAGFQHVEPSQVPPGPDRAIVDRDRVPICLSRAVALTGTFEDRPERVHDIGALRREVPGAMHVHQRRGDQPPITPD